jgi:hypothetical protein
VVAKGTLALSFITMIYGAFELYFHRYAAREESCTQHIATLALVDVYCMVPAIGDEVRKESDGRPVVVLAAKPSSIQATRYCPGRAVVQPDQDQVTSSWS